MEYRAFSAHFAFSARREPVSGVWALSIATKMVVGGVEVPDEQVDTYRDRSLARCAAVALAYAEADRAGARSPMGSALAAVFG